MSGIKGQRWSFQKQFDGQPKDENLKLEEFDVPAVKDGEVLLEAVSLSVDPYMRLFGGDLPIGATMMGEQVAKVTESKNKDYPVGTVVLTSCGWTTHSVSDGSGLTKVEHMPEGLPLSFAIGAAGMPGFAAYYGFVDICEPKAGETVMVSGAAGAVGTVVGQIAKILGCRVIGSAGSDAKVAFLKEIGFDEAFNYKTVTDMEATIKAAAPKGVDVYFDNVGGELTSTVLNCMNLHGRVASCGAISQYNATSSDKIRVPTIWGNVVGMRLKIQGFISFDHTGSEKYQAILKQLVEWIQQGKLKPKEEVTHGFENMYQAFEGLFTGANTGKAIVNVK